MVNGILAALAILALIGGYMAAEHASGHMPFSGYAEEAFWGRVSLGLMISATVLGGLAIFV
jgi:hypothetical protein